MPEGQEDLSRIVDELYERSERLPRKLWYTSTFQELERLVSGRSGKDPNIFRASLRRKIGTVWERYQSLVVTHLEKTAETMAGHRLLVEGLAGWQEALDLHESGASPSVVLEAAEDANRLLVVVQLQAQDLRRPQQ